MPPPPIELPQLHAHENIPAQTPHSAPNPLPSYAPLPSFNTPPQIHALYVHIPFCSTKCDYCDFYSLAGQLDSADAYLAALNHEFALQTAHFGTPSPHTIFIGGGTPTLLSPSQLARLLEILHTHINFQNVTEFTIEANPNTFDPARAALLHGGGVNRISFGAQSFLRNELAVLQRDHDPESVAIAFDTARNAGIHNLNLDLIFGIPGQTLASWDYSLSRALDLASDHVSAYSLMYEPNTAMTARLKRGLITPMPEDDELELFNHVYSRLRDAGYSRYEVSNYARPGKECQHNIHYWKGGNWLALGTSAAAHVNGHRWKNIPALQHYVDAIHANRVPATQMESLNPARRAGEIATFWLRLNEGLNYAEFESRMHLNPQPTLERILQKYVDLGFVTLTPTQAKLTEKAIPISDAILRNIIDAF